ncbi:MAG TPA: alpha-amylase family glycosyl hydrolase, partial [Chitinophagales bacterium]|nr:alpha-amylase family glycosyl hydrolase [Chitinophagales bacterium]
YETIWCSPFFKSPQQDFGYDISDYTSIAPEYGTMADAEQLISEVHKRGMKIVFDMVMNHTSIEHPWFKESESSRTNPKADWYIWRDKPNNWHSMTGGSGWHYCKERNQYYWASFLPFQPDLNYRNPEVKQAMLNNVRFWLKKGVDGFRLDIFNVIYKDSLFRNNPFKMKAAPSESDPSGFFQEAKYTINQPESMEFAKELRAVCNGFGDKMLLGEVSGNRATIRKFLGTDKNDGLGLAFDFEMLPFKFNSNYFGALINHLEKDFPDPFMPVYVFSNHDRRRAMDRLHGDFRKAKVLHFLQLTVRGVPCTYYGEETGMSDTRIPYKKGLDPIAQKYKAVPRFLFDMMGETMNRDEVRSPMQWNSKQNAGFTAAAKTWLPVHTNFGKVNVEEEAADSTSLLHLVGALLKLREQHEELRYGTVQLIEKNKLPKGVLGYKRIYNGMETVVLMNFDKRAKEFELTDNMNILFSINGNSSFANGKIHLGPYGGIILSR